MPTVLPPSAIVEDVGAPHMQPVNLAHRPPTAGPQHDRTRLDILRAKAISLHSLPMLPEVGIRAMAVARDPNSPMAALARIIERDPALATGILKLANSSFYRTGRAVESLDQAVVRLGLRECQNVIITVSMRSLYQKLPATKRRRCELLWRHSFATACVCRRLNVLLDLGFEGEEFTGGLCHDIGRVLIALGAPAYVDLADPLDFHEGPERLAHEHTILGTDHCSFGAWFANLNELPESILSCIQWHHHPAGAGRHARLVELVAVADDMANHLQRDGTADDYVLDSDVAGAALAPGWTPERWERFAEVAPSVLTEVVGEVEGVKPA